MGADGNIWPRRKVHASRGEARHLIPTLQGREIVDYSTNIGVSDSQTLPWSMSMRRTLWQTLKCADSVLGSSRSLLAANGLRSCVRNYNTVTVNAADLSFGQPVHETHPHLLQPGELTPGITAQEYADRRTKLAAKLPDKAIAVVAA